ncbi:SDR family NAD(P)-dependent oxidoreductase [Streptomyces sp. NPDC053367]|uniref:SDR family NAD(P)-dependent oxidoreductase n=1 Tax=Streptomyces sp. NPDC053367 TaxID=3365700 RepID=UPI0037D6B3CE
MTVPPGHDPSRLIAIVGMAGRFPKAPDTDALWRLLSEGGDAIGPVPPDRWDSGEQLDPEKEIQAVGGFIDDVDRLDAEFFGISPREAAAVDPQQRLLLEVGWRALEDAGQRAADLAGTRTGVYVGASWHDYELLRKERGAAPTPHSLVGNALDVIAARLSYFLKVRGPSMTVETGCSSSLVALHLAAQALREGEVDAAIVGATNLMLDPHVTVGLTHFGALAPDGRCKTFSAQANGFVRGEGVAALYLKTLERALADGDRIHGVVVRTVVNNDGGGDSLVTPSPDGQEDLLRRAYDGTGLPPGQPAYIEAHGTGTGRGDPIEVGALGRVLGPGRAADQPLLVGSVKTNIGHLEAAAGMAGLFKLLLAMRHRVVPPSLHSAELNPAIAFDELGVRVVREPHPLPGTGPLYMGVNSFGWGGTNAHVVLMTPPENSPEPAAEDRPRTGLPAVVPLSAHTEPALTEVAARLADAAGRTADDGLDALAGTLAWRRDHFPQRAAVVADSPAQLAERLRAHAAGAEDTDGVTTGRTVPRGRTAFVFPGQGSQWQGMGRELFRDSPLFADVVRRCADALRPHTDWELTDVFTGNAGDEWLTRIDMLQPSLWAMSLGIAELWRAAGVEPDVVLGHSQGEITAATLAGILSYEDAALVMARRSAIARRTSGRGRMLAVDLDRDSALEALAGFEDSVSLAVHNGPRSCVLSGEKDSVLTLKEILEAEGVFCRLVNVDYASHSPEMDPLREDLLTALAPARPRPGRIDLMSTVRVRRLDGPEMDAAYWVENLRSPVLFADTMEALLADGVTHVVEISPHPLLVPAVEQLAAGREEPVAVLPSLRREQGGRQDFALALARGYVSGLEPFGTLPRHGVVPLPGYPLRSERHWTPDRGRGTPARGFEVTLTPAPADPGAWHGTLDLSLADLPWLGDHRVHGTPVLPGTAMLTLAVNTARARTGRAPVRIEDIAFRKEIALGDSPVRLTAEWRDDRADGEGGFRLMSLPDPAGAWQVDATARVEPLAAPPAAPAFPAWAEDTAPRPAEEFYADCAARGLEYGPAFRGVTSLRVGGARSAEALGEVVLPGRLRAGNRPHVLHPALWDGALQVALALCEDIDAGSALVPTGIEAVTLLGDLSEPVTALWSHAVRAADGTFDVRLYDTGRRPLMHLQGVRLTALPGTAGGSAHLARLHRLVWADVTDGEAASTTSGPGTWTVVGTEGAAELADALRARGAGVQHIGRGHLAHGGDPFADGKPDGVVFLAPRRGAGADAQAGGLGELTALVRACTALDGPPRLVVLTAAAQAAGGTEPDPGAALYWGYARVLRREHGELRSRVVDFEPEDAQWPVRCAAELLTDDDEDQVALRAGRRLAGRLVRGDSAADDGAVPLPVPTTAAQPFRLGLVRPGGDHAVGCFPLARRTPGPGEIEVAVTAAALGLSDALRALGLGDPGTDPARPLGAECAGRVTAVGPDVTLFAAGDRVVACAPGALASHVTVRAEHARPVPAELDDQVAAALPLVMTTAWYALVELARVDSDETVLIHSAADGAGLAAVQIARLLGANVLATAATAEKRAYLEELGVARVFDSRGLDWAAQVREATGGRGVDVVLNSLPGAAVRAGLDLLAEDGRFVELGRADIRQGRLLGLDAFAKGISYAALDMPGLRERRPRRFARALAEVWERIVERKLDPLPVRPYGFAEAGPALRELATGASAERFVLLGPGTVDRVTAEPLPGGRLRADGSYLISGGLGGLGLSLARFLAERGAGALILLGRSAPAPGVLDGLREKGARVEAVRCDVGDEAALRTALDAVRGQLPPLRGVVHAAGVLSDATVQNLTDHQIAEVLRPKAVGARHLEAVTAGDPLDFFVLFSSAAALVGNVGQAAYAAANASLDALAEARRRRGLPALSVQWGPFTQVGLAAHDGRRGARLEERGMGGFAPEEAWDALVALLDGEHPVTGYVELDPRRWFDAYPDTVACGSWRPMYELAQRDRQGPASAGGLRAALLAAPAEDRAALLEDTVRDVAGRVLRIAPDRMADDTPFKSLGLDSLMSLELRNRLEGALGLRLSPTLLWAYGTPKALAGALSDLLADAPAPGGEPPETAG